MRNLLLIMMLSLAAGSAACRPSPAESIPTAPVLVGSVEIQVPPEGAIIYAEVVYAAGISAQLPAQGFLLKLNNAEDETLIQVTVVPDSAGHWAVELPHPYNGEPTEMTLIAAPHYDGAPTEIDYAAQPLVLAGQSYRPPGIFGSIFTPTDGATVGGDSMLVSGTVSGVFEGSFSLALIDSTGSAIDTQIVTAASGSALDEVPWTAALATHGYTGAAEIRVLVYSADDGSESVLAKASIVITQDAG